MLALGAWMLASSPSPVLDQVAKALGPFRNRGIGFTHSRRRIPEHIEFKIRRYPPDRSLEIDGALFHDNFGDREGLLLVLPIGGGGRETLPDFWLDLVAGNLAGRAHCAVVVSGFNLRKGAPTVHRLDLQADHHSRQQPQELQSH